MSWRRDESRYGSQGSSRERQRSPWSHRNSPDRRHEESPRNHYRDRYDRKDRSDRDRERRERDEKYRREPRDRYDRRDRDRDRHRSPRFDDADIPNAPSPPKISQQFDDNRSKTKSRSPEADPNNVDNYDQGDMDIDSDAQTRNSSSGDWLCKCGSYNYKDRQTCYRRNCKMKKNNGKIIGDTDGPESPHSGITKKILFRRLDALTTEERILEVLKDYCSKAVLDSITGISVGRETLTGVSKCTAFLTFANIADSQAAYSELMSLESPLVIDDKQILISYYQEAPKNKNPPTVNNDYSTYYAQMAAYNTMAMSEADRVNAAAAVAQSAINAAQARQWTPGGAPTFATSTTQSVPAANIPTGDGKTKYSPPDVNTFLYDETSGYYYDPTTGLYYDGTTQYFFNNQINQYMYWDAAASTYKLATQSQQNTDQPKLPSPPDATTQNTIVKEPEEKKKKESKDDKVKVAKKIAKDMERWARTLNQKKENAKANYVMEQPSESGPSKGSADIGFSVLGSTPSMPIRQREISPPIIDDFLLKPTEQVFETDEAEIIDWAKLMCLLCKRKFPSAEVLTKHKTMSDLHKQNLAEYKRKNSLQPQINGYRDRAAERRMKFGEDEPVPINRKRYEMPESSAPAIPFAPPPSVVDTIGGKMLQKMGWSQGRGLGKEEQGRIAPIEAEQRPSLAGLGQKRGIYTPTPGETYRDTVKKLMIARYKEVVGDEDGN